MRCIHRFDSIIQNQHHPFCVCVCVRVIGHHLGNEIVDMVASVNEIHTDSSAPRITVDTDWADGLISR